MDQRYCVCILPMRFSSRTLFGELGRARSPTIDCSSMVLSSVLRGFVVCREPSGALETDKIRKEEDKAKIRPSSGRAQLKGMRAPSPERTWELLSCKWWPRAPRAHRAPRAPCALAALAVLAAPSRPPSGPRRPPRPTTVEEIRGEMRELRIRPALLRCLSPYVTKEKPESIYQK